VRASPVLQLAAPPTLALVVFRLVPPGFSIKKGYQTDATLNKELNSLNLKLHDRVSQLFLTRTDLDGSICIRMSTGGYRTEKRHVISAFEVLEKEAEQVIGLWAVEIDECVEW
jgi:glutamate/tyrosine decarboxylase-like PLP-dependent enzyme